MFQTFSSFVAKPRPKKSEKNHGAWGFNEQSPHQVSVPDSIHSRGTEFQSHSVRFFCFSLSSPSLFSEPRRCMQVPCPSFSLVTSASSPGQIARREARAPWSRLEREGRRGICSGFMQLQRGVVGRTRGGTQLQTGGAGWGSACGHALMSREYFLPIRSLCSAALEPGVPSPSGTTCLQLRLPWRPGTRSAGSPSIHAFDRQAHPSIIGSQPQQSAADSVLVPVSVLIFVSWASHSCVFRPCLIF